MQHIRYMYSMYFYNDYHAIDIDVVDLFKEGVRFDNWSCRVGDGDAMKFTCEKIMS